MNGCVEVRLDAGFQKHSLREPVSIFETGGSTGVPKSRVNIRDYQTDYELYSETLSDKTFPRGSDWLMLGPSGPRRLRLSIEHLAQHRGGICFMVDLIHGGSTN